MLFSVNWDKNIGTINNSYKSYYMYKSQFADTENEW